MHCGPSRQTIMHKSDISPSPAIALVKAKAGLSIVLNPLYSCTIDHENPSPL